MADGKSAKSNRGFWLTTFLVIWITGAGIATLHYLLQGGQVWNSEPDMPFWSIPFLVIASAMELTGYLAIWNWKKWGVYCVLGATSALFLFKMIFFDGQPPVWYPDVTTFISELDALSSGLGLVLFAIWILLFGLVIRLHWNNLK
jgi:hypothetical protein